MLGTMFANGGLNQFRLQLAGEPERFGLILDFLGQLCEFKAQKELVHRRQGARPQRGHLGHHVGQEQGGIIGAHVSILRHGPLIQTAFSPLFDAIKNRSAPIFRRPNP